MKRWSQGSNWSVGLIPWSTLWLTSSWDHQLGGADTPGQNHHDNCAHEGGAWLSLSFGCTVHVNDSLIALFKMKWTESNETQQQPPALVVLVGSGTKIRLCVWGSGFYWSQSILCVGNICKKQLLNNVNVIGWFLWGLYCLMMINWIFIIFK